MIVAVALFITGGIALNMLYLLVEDDLVLDRKYILFFILIMLLWWWLLLRAGKMWVKGEEA